MFKTGCRRGGRAARSRRAEVGRAAQDARVDPGTRRAARRGHRDATPVRGGVVQQRTIGDVQVSAIGLGGMPMSIEGRPDRVRSVATIHAALEAGVTLIDTADAYHLHANEVGHNETLIAEALGSFGGDISDVLVATKGGHLRPGDGSWTVNGDPEYLKRACEAS